jgi:hypothetical protein
MALPIDGTWVAATPPMIMAMKNAPYLPAAASFSLNCSIVVPVCCAPMS